MNRSPLSRPLLLAASFLFIVSSLQGAAKDQTPSITQQRTRATELSNQGNSKEAFVIFKQLVLNPDNIGKALGQDMSAAYTCIARLQNWEEFDAFIKDAAEKHPDDWHLMAEAARAYHFVNHHGYVQENVFRRTNEATGRFTNCFEQDRAR